MPPHLNFWDQFHPQVGFQFSGYRLVLPRVNSLDKFERDHHFPLPKSYRDFALSFGLGRLYSNRREGEKSWSLSWEMTCPGFRKLPWDCDPAVLTRSVINASDKPPEETSLAQYDNLERVKRLMLFCTSNNVDYWGWDPEDVSDEAEHEYGIYQMLRVLDDNRVLKIASTFREFILDYCCEGKLHLDPNAGPAPRIPRNARDSPDDYEIVFGQSSYYRMKSKRS